MCQSVVGVTISLVLDPFFKGFLLGGQLCGGLCLCLCLEFRISCFCGGQHRIVRHELLLCIVQRIVGRAGGIDLRLAFFSVLHLSDVID